MATVTINLSQTELNADWIRSARLLKRAKAGDKAAEAEMKRLDESPMLTWSELRSKWLKKGVDIGELDDAIPKRTRR